MSDPLLTRRTVLAGAAGAGAATLISPAVGLADSLGRRPEVFALALGTLDGLTPELPAPRPFTLIGLEWSRPADARLELRTRAPGGRWSQWTPASIRGHGPDQPARTTGGFGQPIWTGLADAFQVRSAGAVSGLRVHFVYVPVGTSGAHASGVLPLAQPVLDAGPGQPPIIARRAWARGAKPAVAPGFGNVKLAFVHHTDNPNGYGPDEVPAMLRAMYVFHRYVQGWHDIGYNFVIDLFGRIWEARTGGIDQAVIGAQAGGYNEVSTGVAVLGTFMDAVPSAAALDALERLLAWKLSLHGVPSAGHVSVRVAASDYFYTPFRPNQLVSLPRVAGHRDGDSTTCPGDAFYARLPALRPRIAKLAGTPPQLTANLAPRGSHSAPARLTVSGRLGLADGAPLEGATILLQQLAAGRASVLAQLTTAADGTWSTTLTLSRNLMLRALHADPPAIASELLQVAIAPAITLELVSSAPLRVAGTVLPSARAVTVDVYSLAGRHRKRVAHRRVSGRSGRFSARIRLSRPGRYGVVARTEPSAHNAAGVSSPVTVDL